VTAAGAPRLPGTASPRAPAAPPARPPAPAAAPARGSDYAELCRLVRRHGLLDRRPRYYAVKLAVMAVALAGGLAAFGAAGDSWWQLLVAVYLAGLAGQFGFLGHEAGHRQIFRSRRANDLAGLACGNLLIGMGFGWWAGKHQRHHTHPNQLGADPDVNLRALAFTPQQASSRHGLARAVARAQAWLFFPMLALQALSMHMLSVRAVLGGTGPARRRWLEGALLLAHFAGYLAAVAITLSPLRAVAFIAVQQGLLGIYLGCAFAPNHKGMPVLGEQEQLDFLRRQVLTSRNVRGGPLVESLLGGLNYQIEHHLFPSMPRPSLRRCRGLVRAFCAQRGLPYCEMSLAGSYAEVLRHLHATGRGLSPAPAG
jgi:fatty acid desaturase